MCTSKIEKKIVDNYQSKYTGCPKNVVLTTYLLPYPGCLNVHEKNMEKMFQTKK
jgi:hypothetical protein